MSLPKPDHVERRLDELAEIIHAIRNEYRWAYGIAYPALRGSGEAKVSSGPSDPTGSVATSSEGARHRMRSAWKATGRALGALRQAEEDLLRITDQGDLRRSGGRHLLTVQPEELQSYREAKRRREERGESWGEG